MLDENLPTFFIKPSDNDLQSTIFLGQSGNDLKPEYTIKKPDPNLPAAKNCYAIALYDSYNPEVLFAEVLVQPEWTQPTLSAAEIRAQNGMTPPPVPLVPSDFTIQLYNPDQQVKVKQIEGKWGSSAHWEFEMPQQTFRMPSASALDRTQDDPAALDITPKVAFKWKRDGKLSKNVACYLSGKSTNGKKSKEPDITLAMFKGGKELTIYEPNMHRVDVEDAKGLEVVMILGALVIRDIFFDPSREMFNISGSQPLQGRKNSNPVIGGRKNSGSNAMVSGGLGGNPSPPVRVPTSQIPPPPPGGRPHASSRPPPADPRTQWEIDRETERLRKVVEAEEKERARAEKEEERRIKKMLEAEAKERKRREEEVAKETERLRRQYGVKPQGPQVRFSPPPQMPPRPPQNGRPVSGAGLSQFQSAPHTQPQPFERPMSTGSHLTGATLNEPFSGPSLTSWMGGGGGGGSGVPTMSGAVGGRPQQQSGSGPYLQAPGQGPASSSGFFGSLSGGGGKKVQKKRSVFF